MSDVCIKVRANPSTGELEIEGTVRDVREWWDRLWPEVGKGSKHGVVPSGAPQRSLPASSAANGHFPEAFGEYYTDFRTAITDVDKMLIAATFAQAKDQDHAFTTKAANELLVDQNIKVGNPSECVRRLTQSKRVFVVSGGEFRVSANGLEYLKSLKSNV